MNEYATGKDGAKKRKEAAINEKPAELLDHAINFFSGTC